MMTGAILHFFSTDGFLPHGMCYLWRPGVLSLHVISDAMIGLAYYSITFTLAYLIRRRKDLEFDWIIGCFAIFIIACGSTHLMAIVTIWHPYYWIAGAIKAVTAAASVPTAVVLVKLMPQALRWPSPTSLRQTNEELQRTNARLICEIGERERAQAEARLANQALQGQLTEMRRLHEMSTRLAQVQQLPDVLGEILDTTIDLQKADFGGLLLYDDKTESLHIVAQRGFSREFMDHFERVRIDDGSACGRALKMRERVTIEDASHDPDYAPHRSIAGHLGYRGIQAAPIIGRGGHIKGMLSTLFRKPHRPSENHLRLTDLYLRLAGELIERATDEQTLREARDAADLANRGKGRFLATASHDLRQPLQTLALLNGSLRRMSTKVEVSQALMEQEEAIVAMSRLINMLLDISKLESGAVQPEVRDFSLEVLFQELRMEFSGVAHKKGLSLQIAHAREVARSDPTLLGQILRNLVSNAIRYTPRGIVRVRCEPEGEEKVRIDVNDSGIGIAEEHLPHIFEEFYQVGVFPNAVREGHGLGLSIVQRAMQLLHHELRVQSKLGRGTTFSIVLRAGVPTESRPSGAAQPVGAKVARGAHILVVDDDPAVLNATRMLLRVEGFAVSAASSLAEAVGVAAQHKDIRVLVTDYHLGNGDLGTQLIGALRGVIGAQLGVVLVSGDTSGVIGAATVHDPRVRVASKPIIAEELLRIVSELNATGERPQEQ